MNWSAVDPSILGPAFVAGLLVLATHVPLGRQVLARGIIFLDLAIAQIAGLGVIIADRFGWETSDWPLQLVAISAALLAALLLYWTEKRWPRNQEAIIGTVFVLAASSGILLLSTNPHSGERLTELLAGQILWISYEQLLPTAVIYAMVLAVWAATYRHRSSLVFYTLFAITVTRSVQLAGVYLVFASLIIPALATHRSTKGALLPSYGIGIVGYGLGLILSALFDLPSGAMVVWMLAVVGTIWVGISRTARRKAT